MNLEEYKEWTFIPEKLDKIIKYGITIKPYGGSTGYAIVYSSQPEEVDKNDCIVQRSVSFQLRHEAEYYFKAIMYHAHVRSNSEEYKQSKAKPK